MEKDDEIRVPVLGHHVELGSLFDILTWTASPDPNQQLDVITIENEEYNTGHQLTVVDNSSLESATSALGLKGDEKILFVASYSSQDWGLFGPVGEVDATTRRATIYGLKINDCDSLSRGNPDEMKTVGNAQVKHSVYQIQRVENGLEIAICAELHRDTSEEADEAYRQLLNSFQNLVSGKKNPTVMENVQITIKGDLSSLPPAVTEKQLPGLLANLGQFFQSHHQNVNAKRAYAYRRTLIDLDESVGIAEERVAEVLNCFETFQKLETKLNKMFASAACSQFIWLQNGIRDKLLEPLISYKEEFKNDVKGIVQKFHSGVLSNTEANDLLRGRQDSWIIPIDAWNAIQEDLEMLDRFAEKVQGIKQFSSIAALQKMAVAKAGTTIFCLQFNPTAILSGLIERNLNIRDALKFSGRFVHFLSANNGNSKNFFCILNNEKASDSSPLRSTVLNENDELVEFIPPEMVKKVVLVSITATSVKIAWEKAPGAEGYAVAHKVEGDTDWRELRVPNTETEFEFSHLAPAPACHEFKVASNCHFGNSGFTSLTGRVQTLSTPGELPVVVNQNFEDTGDMPLPKTDAERLANQQMSMTTGQNCLQNDESSLVSTAISGQKNGSYVQTKNGGKSEIGDADEQESRTNRLNDELDDQENVQSKPLRTRPILESLLKEAEQLTYENPYVFLLKGNLKHDNKRFRINRFVYGADPPVQIKEKIFLILGQTGSGKSTLINAISNFIFGVELTDDFRVRLIREPSKGQGLSDTDSINLHTMYNPDGPIDYIVTVIDTPGFMDTSGFDKDEFIKRQLHELFSDSRWITHINAVGIVVQSGQAKITEAQKYIFNCVTSMFAKDVENNIFLMCTFADNKKPVVLEAARAAELPFREHFMFNNCALYEAKIDFNAFTDLYWKMGTQSVSQFFEKVKEVAKISTESSKAVMEERSHLQTLINGLQPQIWAGVRKMSEIRQTKAVLAQRRLDINSNKNFTITVDVSSSEQVKLQPGKAVTNCLHCHFTCHNDCAYARDDQKKDCSAMNNGKCQVCAEKCDWTLHVNNGFIYRPIVITKVQTIQEMKEKYGIAVDEFGQFEQLLKNMEHSLKIISDTVCNLIREVQLSLKRLNDLALRPCAMTSPQYVELLIETEKREHKDGFMERIQMLEMLKERAKLLDGIANGSLSGLLRTEDTFFDMPTPTSFDNYYPLQRSGNIFTRYYRQGKQWIGFADSEAEKSEEMAKRAHNAQKARKKK